MNIRALAPSLALLAVACGGDPQPDAPSNAVVANTTAPTASPTPSGGNGLPPVSAANARAAEQYRNGDVAREALAKAPPSIAGVPAGAIASANELAVCRMTDSIRHGAAARAPNEIEVRMAAFDLASNPKALEQCRARG